MKGETCYYSYHMDEAGRCGKGLLFSWQNHYSTYLTMQTESASLLCILQTAEHRNGDYYG